jgi:dolichyl-phosphate-mannose-protein mannosyltransferase
MLQSGTAWGRRTVLLLATIAFMSAFMNAFIGGFLINAFGQRVSSNDPMRPLVAGVLLAGFYAAMARHHWRTDANWVTRVNLPIVTAALCTGIALLVGIHYGNFMGGGPDPSGYVSEADMWAQGKLTIPAPGWASKARWTFAVWSSAPIGYRPSLKPLEFAPIYSPGYPLMMAAFQKVGGRDAVFYVLPLLGALAVWASYLLGRHLANSWAGAIAALLMLCSPIFLWFLVRPMSDVPVTACWAMALVLALSGRSRGAVLSGIATAAAILVRPNLVPLAAVPVLLLATTPETRIRRVLLFGLTTVPAALAIAALNWYWYGSPLTSGYGNLDSLYSTNFILPNLQHYWGWLIDTQTPLILLAFAAPFVLQALPDERYRLVLLTVIYPMAVLAMYATYLVFDGWWYLRFLLPAFPVLFASLGAILVECVRQSRRRPAAILLVGAITASIALQGWRYAHHQGAFAGEERFARAVDFANSLPENAVLVSLAYSGTLHFYTGRDVLRWELLLGYELDGALAYLRSQGYPLYFIGDPFEVTEFQSRFAGQDTLVDFERRRLPMFDAGYVAYDLSAP